MPSSFATFFEKATGYSPYDYQNRLAEMVRCESDLIHIPTGLGKTAAVVMAWLYHRLQPTDAHWPRRLVFCLPMRTLVEQTQDNVRGWIEHLHHAVGDLGLSENARAELAWLCKHSPIVLMGGEQLDKSRRDWDIHPERPGILIGTQDMLLSRALNRGYGMSRFRWPVHFALLNNDCLWVMDEVQLMGVGVETSAQLTGFRSMFSTVGPCSTWWMSATLDSKRLCTIDYPHQETRTPLCLEAADREQVSVSKRLEAVKKISKVYLLLESDSAKAISDYARKLAKLTHVEHRSGRLTLVVLNRVDRTQEVFRALTKQVDCAQDGPELALIHSRFRPEDRKRQEKKLKTSSNCICVATQAVEAGMDLDADWLVTELAPWSSLVQRFGRCNRHGLHNGSRIFWVDLRFADDKAAAPYSLKELDASRDALGALEGKNANPEMLASVKIEEHRVIRPVIRRRDILDLFDTTPDLAGNDLDVSRYIRDGEDSDVSLFWREFDEKEGPAEQAKPVREEFCSVPVQRLRDFLRKAKAKTFVWDILEGIWEVTDVVMPGGVYMLSASAGGYSNELGWTGDPKSGTVSCLPPDASPPDATSENPTSLVGAPVVLERHTNDVVQETNRLVKALELTRWEAVLSEAAQWHDIGKAHNEFQVMLRAGIGAEADTSELLAKSGTNKGRCNRRYFRHELLSALAWLHAKPEVCEDVNLTAYLIASHHGKVRLSIRSLPQEEPPKEFKGKRIARGVVEGETIPPVRLGAINLPEFTVNLSLMEMGACRNQDRERPSWLARSLALRDALGPFRLAFLEAVFRAADMVASQVESDGMDGLHKRTGFTAQ